jgi:hypothetical protein
MKSYDTARLPARRSSSRLLQAWMILATTAAIGTSADLEPPSTTTTNQLAVPGDAFEVVKWIGFHRRHCP